MAEKQNRIILSIDNDTGTIELEVPDLKYRESHPMHIHAYTILCLLDYILKDAEITKAIVKMYIEEDKE